ncbi:MAG: SUMF1/EgtB/PvdO family nonheme iron enzyme, partial [Candidatus Eisenbacteria sp.]|nr:SUMF1/EgtB/PvdO family nonheme iron enzyme [Candidatus Eisenbacteria bacterium]
GNVWEWCNDWWVCDLGTTPVIDPTGPSSGNYRVLRGGSWGYDGINLRCAYRSIGNPSYNSYSRGFRVARTVSAP